MLASVEEKAKAARKEGRGSKIESRGCVEEPASDWGVADRDNVENTYSM